MKNVQYLILVSVFLLAECASTPSVTTTPASASQEKPAQVIQPPPAQPAPAAAAESAPPTRLATQPAAQNPAAPPSSLSAEALGIYRSPEELQKPPTKDELAVIASAKTLVGKRPNESVSVNGKRFVLDCIGTVSAVFYRLWLDVTKDFGLYSGDGVSRLYKTLKERNVLHTDKYPRPGDVIIWDNTWDSKGNGDRIHDPRTHAGIVLAVDEDGTIHYVHENLYKGVVIETMNLLHPTAARDEQGKMINTGLAIPTKSGGPRPAHWLSGDVFNTFGDVLGVKDYFFVEQAQSEKSTTAESAEVALIHGH